MSFLDILLIAIGLSMDAFAVSIGKGLSVKKTTVGNALTVGFWFGGFQALMPLIGYFLIIWFSNIPAIQTVIEACDHWVAFVLLALIGGNMLREAFSKGDECEIMDSSFGFKTMFVMAIATSIDALATGITFGCLDSTAADVQTLSIWADIAIIGVTTFLFSVVGLKIGNFVGCKFHRGAEMLGGFVLIAIGLKVLLEHLL